MYQKVGKKNKSGAKYNWNTSSMTNKMVRDIERRRKRRPKDTWV